MSDERTLMATAESLRKQIVDQQNIVDKLTNFVQEDGVGDENL